MEKAKKVHVEVVKKEKRHKWLDKIKLFLIKIKLIIAVALDLVDLVLGNIPLLNTLWDIVTWFVLLIILKDKRLAFFSLTELVLPGIPILGQIDAFIPIATILTLIDIGEAKFKVIRI